MSTIFTIDAHAAGEPCRLVYKGLPSDPCADMPGRRAALRERFDWVRTGLMHEPRGHGGMFGALLGEPMRRTSRYSLIFFDPAGYLEGCGHGTLCSVAAWRRLNGDATLPFAIDNPDGSMTRVVEIRVEGNACASTLEMPPAYVLYDDLVLGNGHSVRAGLARCGNTYLLVDARTVGVASLGSATQTQIREIGMSLLGEARAWGLLDDRPAIEVLLYAPLANGTTFSTAVLFNGTQIDRSPCGTGSCALVALLTARGELRPGTPVRTVGPVGLPFDLRTRVSDARGCRFDVTLSGSAFIMGVHEWILSDDDPFRAGYIFS